MKLLVSHRCAILPLSARGILHDSDAALYTMQSHYCILRAFSFLIRKSPYFPSVFNTVKYSLLNIVCFLQALNIAFNCWVISPLSYLRLAKHELRQATVSVLLRSPVQLRQIRLCQQKLEALVWKFRQKGSQHLVKVSDDKNTPRPRCG